VLHAGVSNKTNTIVLPNHRRRGSRMGGSTSKVTLADERLRLSLDKLGPNDTYRKQMEDWLTASTMRATHKVPLTPPRDDTRNGRGEVREARAAAKQAADEIHTAARAAWEAGKKKRKSEYNHNRHQRLKSEEELEAAKHPRMAGVISQLYSKLARAEFAEGDRVRLSCAPWTEGTVKEVLYDLSK
jgi:hypothetical protein